jgi:hypothetical protein
VTRSFSRALGVVGYAVALLVGFAFGTGRFAEVDTWWHLRVGQHILDTHQLRGTDPWAAFAVHPYTATQWLPEAVAAWLVDHTGMGAVVWLRSLASLTLVVLLYLTARQSAGRLTSSAAAAVAMLGCGAGLNPRPQLVSFLCFAVVVLAWSRTLRDGRPRWWLIPVFWLWGCSHGLWTFGLLVSGVFLAAIVLDPATRPDRRRSGQLVGLVAACAAVLALTPLGPALLLTPFDVAANAAGLAEEWRATPVNNIFALAALGMGIATALAWLLTRHRPRPWELAQLTLSLALTLVMWRLVPLGAILAAPLLATALQPLVGRAREGWSRRERRAVLASWAAALALATALAAGSVGATAQQFPGKVGTVDAALAELPAGTVVMDDFGLSGWLLWKHPSLKPVIDLRVELYSPEHIAAYRRTERVEPGWQDLLTKTRASYAVLRTDSALRGALQDRLGWSAVATGGDYTVLRAPGERG